MNMRALLATAALATAVVGAVPGVAHAGTNEVKHCGSAYAAKKIQVNKYTTSCKLGRAVAKYISTHPLDMPSFKVRGVKTVRMSATRTGPTSYYVYGGKGAEVSLTMYAAGG